MGSAKNIIFGLFLLAAACQDLKEKSISVLLFAVFGFAGLCLWAVDERSLVPQLLNFLPGLAVLLLSLATRGEVGMGDGFFFFISGFYLPLVMNCKLLIYGLLFSGLSCAVIYIAGLVRGKNAGKSTVPFIPFLVPVWLGLVIK